MSKNRNYSQELTIIAKQKEKERAFWLTQLAGNLVKTGFPYDVKSAKGEHYQDNIDALTFQFAENEGRDIVSKLMQLSKGSDYTLNMILITGIIFLLYKYTGNKDILVGTPIYKQKTEAQFINTVIVLRNLVENHMTFKKLLLQVRHTLKEANDNQNYPIEALAEKLNIEAVGERSLLFDVAILFENIHKKEYLPHNCCSMIFSFKKEDQCLQCTVEYNPSLYEKTAIKNIIDHFKHLLGQALFNLDKELSHLQMLTEKEKEKILYDFNQTQSDYPQKKTIHQWFDEQVEKTPNHIAVSSPMDLSEIFDQLQSETIKQSMDEKIGACCFKKNPYLYSIPLKLPPGNGSLILLKTHRHNSVTINNHMVKLLEGFDGNRNLRWIYSWIKHIEKSKGIQLEFDFYSTNRTDLLEITFQSTRQQQKFSVHDFTDLVRLIQFLYKNHLIELAGVEPGESFPGDSIIEGWEENKEPVLGNELTLQTIPGENMPLVNARVLLLGDTPGMPTTGLLYLASYLRRNGVKAVCQFYDPSRDHKTMEENIEMLLENIQPKIVALSLKWFLYIARVVDMGKIVKSYARKHALDIKVVVGGNTASYYWEELSKYDCIDMLVRGDGEEPLLKICQGEDTVNIPNCVYKKNGQIIANPITYIQDENHSPGIYLSHLDEILLSNRTTPLGTFFIYTHKGCAMSCMYCGGCSRAQQKTFNRKKVLRRGIEEVRKDIMAAQPYTSTFHFEFDIVDTQENLLDYCKKIWADIDLSRHFCMFSTLITPSEALIRLLSHTFKYVYWDYDVCTFSQRQRQELFARGLVKPQPSNADILEFMARCEPCANIEVRINLITGLPYFMPEDIEPGEALLSKIITYSSFGELHWARLHAQPGAPIVENPTKHHMHSYAANFDDFLKFSKENFKQDSPYPFLDDLAYPYIYFKDDRLNSKVTNLYLETNRKIHQIISDRRKGLIVSDTLTYRELDEAARQLCEVLRAKGVGPGQIVGLMLERSIDIPVGILGIMKAGCAYMPIDPEFPGGRIEYMLKDSKAKTLVTTRLLAEESEKVTRWESETILLEPGFCQGRGEVSSPVPNQVASTNGRGDPAPTDQLATCHLPPATCLAYVIYTSGTTGNPKGVLLTHENLVNYVHWFSSAANLTQEDKTILTSSFAFDLGYTSLYTSILNGSQLHILPREMYLLAERLLDYIKQQGITYLKVTPSLFSIIANSPYFSVETCKSLRLAAIGGEAIHVEDIEKAHSICPHIRIMNHYGPTEATIGCVAVLIDFDQFETYKQTPVIGKPIYNTRVYIFNKSREILPPGVPGELCISGTCLARGYLNRPALTAEKFKRADIRHSSFVISSSQRLSKFTNDQCPMTNDRSHSSHSILPLPHYPIYMTGDLARWLPNGTLEFLGRIDKQVKVRGYRIELEEIENRLLKHNEIENALVVVKNSNDDKIGDKYLCAYIVPKRGKRKLPEAPQIHPTEYKPVTGGDILTGIRQFEQQVKAKSDQIAVKSNGRSLTYKSLNQLANRVSNKTTKEYDDRYKLSKSERVRYKRQLLLHEWGIASQEKLKSTTVFVAGAGGGASPTIVQLALAGFGTIIVCDCDVVELSNLNRQFLHDEIRIGMNKALSAKMTIERINPNVNIIPVTEKLTRENVFQLVGDAAIIIDMFDGMEDKFILSQCALTRGIPHIISAMTDINSYAVIFHPPKTPCYHCIFDREKLKEVIEGMSRYMDKYEKSPLPVAATSLFMSTGFAVNEAIKIILGFENPAYNKFMFFNQRGTETLADTQSYKAMTYNFSEHFRRVCKHQGFDWEIGWRGNFLEELEITPNPNCPLCGNKSKEIRNALEEQMKKVKNISFSAEMKAEKNTAPKDMRNTVALLLSCDINMAVAITAAAKSGKTYVPLDPVSSLDTLNYMLEDSEARIILADNEHLQLAEKLRKKVNKNIKVINIDGIEELKESKENINQDNPDLEIEPGSPAYILYSHRVTEKETRMESPFNASMMELHQALLEGDGNYLLSNAKNRKNQDSTTLSGNLRQYLLEEIPDYMIPSYFVQLEKIPLTPNGKVDIKALPEPGTEEESQEEFIAPRNEVEEKLAEVWSDVLGIEKDTISINTNFFEVGGHSLNAAVMVARVHKELNLKLSLAEVFGVPTLKEIASLVSVFQWTGDQDQEITSDQEEEEVIL